MEYIEKTLTGIITHGTNSITFTDDFITNESIIDVYFSDDDISPTEQEQIGNRLIISIEPQNYDVSIAIHITNDDTINYADELESLSDTVDEHTTAISDLAVDIDSLNASNISYDEHSTLYSAMGDIDELETTSKNLVDAINENFLSVSNGKTLLADAITDKGVTTSATDTFETMAHNIGEIETGGGGSFQHGFVTKNISSYSSAGSSALTFTVEKSGILTILASQFGTTSSASSNYPRITKNNTIISSLYNVSTFSNSYVNKHSVSVGDVINVMQGAQGATARTMFINYYIE